MSEPEKSLQNFLRRWSRRKLAAAERTAETPDSRAEETDSAQPNARAEALPESAAAAFDPASLPPIESIEAATDIRAFLAPGVPIELTRAALRRAWVSDPTIRDFIGLAENQWDFTQPAAVPGFGSLDLTPELRRMLAGFYSEAPASDARSSDVHSDGTGTNEDCGEKAPSDHASTSLPDSRAANSLVAEPQAIRRAGDSNAAVQNDFVGDEPSQAPARRKHGAALPE
jgi:Protein of unknown function (DUF3306)